MNFVYIDNQLYFLLSIIRLSFFLSQIYIHTHTQILVMKFEIDIELIKDCHLSILNINEHIVSLIIGKKSNHLSNERKNVEQCQERLPRKEAFERAHQSICLSIMFDGLQSSIH